MSIRSDEFAGTHKLPQSRYYTSFDVFWDENGWYWKMHFIGVPEEEEINQMTGPYSTSLDAHNGACEAVGIGVIAKTSATNREGL